MTAPITRSIVCPVLIGRQSHLDALVQCIEQAHNGRGQTILVSGEAGIGKSRLIAEAISNTRASHSPTATLTTLVLEGRCFEPDRSLPYAPFLDVLRSFLTVYSSPDLAALLGSAAAELARLLPEFADFVPELTPAPALDAEQEKRRLFRAILHFFTRLSTLQPLVIIIEDIHWSDDSSLECLLFLARSIASLPILLLLTYRNEEEHPALLSFLASLERGRLATEVTLSHLSIDEMEAMVRLILGQSRAVRVDFIAALYTLTEGNPFFIEEVLKSLVASGAVTDASGKRELSPHESTATTGISLPGHAPLPRSVMLAIQQRLNQLSVEARDVLSFAAVVGRRFDFALLQHLSGRNETDLLRLVKELIVAQMVVEESEDVLAFRHALTRQAAYTDLLARERRSLHHSVAQTMEHLYASSLESRLGDLAYHYYMAREWAKVLAYAQRAGEKAQGLYALHAAITQYTRAIEANQQLAHKPTPALYRARAQCYEFLGDASAAREDYTRSLEAAQATHDAVMEWQSLLDLGYLWTGLDYAQAGDYFQRALTLARTMNDPFMLARTLNRVGNWHMNLEQPVEGQRYHREALAIFEAGTDQHGLAETLDFLGVAHLMSGDLSSSTDYYVKAIALWRTLGDQQGLIASLTFFAGRGGLYFTATVVPSAANATECIRDAEEAIALSHQLGMRSSEAFALIFLGLCLGYRGEYERALSNAETGLNIATEIEHGPWMATGYLLLGTIALDLLALPTARQHLEHALTLAKECGSLFLIGHTTAFLASTYIAMGEFARAQAILDAMLGPHTPCQTLAQRLAWCARAEMELAQNHADKAIATLDRLTSSATYREDGAVIPALCYRRGEALVALGRVEEAMEVLCSARDAAQQQGVRPLLWRIDVALGTLYGTQNQREQAEEAFAQARTIIEELAGCVPESELRANFLRSASAQLPRLPQPTPRQAAREALGGLTGRECEVAVLIAQGKSSRTIANELILSERTIEKHAERILSKLGFSSRVQIAAWVIEKGLLNHSQK